AIKEDYEKVVQQRQVATRLPEAWSKLVAKADDFLIDIVAEKVESLCGHRPTDEQILDFLKNLERIQLGETFPSPTPQSFSTFANQRSIGSKAPPKRLVVTMPNGEVIQHHNAMATFREVIFKLGPENVLQVDREGKLISTEPISQRRTTPYRGYHVTGNHGTPVKRNLLEKIAERLRVPLKVEIVD
ncbi:MAG: hypothetical protein OXI24_00145, partial [Candidatus Poribacteria bacterium]|nr:hypothetical protein [Candidatus Poribacteria bacterium]